MDQRLIGTMFQQATFVAGYEPWWREKSDPVVVSTIENAATLLEKIGDSLGKPQITGGTTADPSTVISLFWMVRKAKRIYGVTVNFKDDLTCQLTWSSPSIRHQISDNMSIRELIDIDIPRLFDKIEVETRKEFHRLHN